MTKTLWLALLAAASALVLPGCSERPTVVYKQGYYQGKADTQPWNNAKFKGDKASWEAAIKQRELAQNEYLRAQ